MTYFNRFALAAALVMSWGVTAGVARAQERPAEQPAAEGAGFSVLVFSKTAGFRHDCIPAGAEMIRRLGAAHGFSVTATEDAGMFTQAELARHSAVVFLCTTGDVLNAAQQEAFERYIGGGGAFVGIHSATDTEYAWPFYRQLVGTYFASHPPQQTARIDIVDVFHPSTAGLPRVWTRFDEWYNFQGPPGPGVRVLARLDETSYTGGTMGGNHPIAWCHEQLGGRAWYTGAGHTIAGYSDPQFEAHVWGGINWAAVMHRSPRPAGPGRVTAGEQPR